MISRRAVWVVLPLLVAALLTSPFAIGAPARESDEVLSARQHFKAGEKAFNAGDYKRALLEFEAGYVLVPRPGFLLNMAHTERRLGNAGRARELYQQYLEADPKSTQRDEVLGLMADLDRTLSASARGESAPPPPPAAVTNPMAADAGPVPAPVEPVSEEPAPVPDVAPPARAAVPVPEAPAPVEEPADPLSLRQSREAAEPSPAHGPVYTRWWFWAAVGVVAVGATTGIILATRPAAPVFRDDGSLGRIGGP